MRDITRLDELLGEHFPDVKQLLDRLEISRLWVRCGIACIRPRLLLLLIKLCAEPMLCLWSKSLSMPPARLWDIFLLDGSRSIGSERGVVWLVVGNDAVLAAMLASISLAYPKMEGCLIQEKPPIGQQNSKVDTPEREKVGSLRTGLACGDAGLGQGIAYGGSSGDGGDNFQEHFA